MSEGTLYTKISRTGTSKWAVKETCKPPTIGRNMSSLNRSDFPYSFLKLVSLFGGCSESQNDMELLENSAEDFTGFLGNQMKCAKNRFCPNLCPSIIYFLTGL